MAAAAAHCWRWCDGWNPQHWLAYDQFHAVDDWQMVIELMQLIREAR